MKQSDRYQNINVSIYCTAYDVQKMADLAWLEARFDVISRYIKVNKIYLETHRDRMIVEETTMRQAKAFFEARGVEVAGGITYTLNERNRFQTYCYTDAQQRQWAQEVIEYTASLFDEVILDDFFFTNCKCEQCIAAKGDRTWSAYRLELMTEAAQNVIIGPANAVNPKVKVVVKYPNWYEHFHGLGFNLETQPALFDGLYTGTETRDPVMGNQHFQAYHGYSIMRYFENIKPGGNGGGWVDPFASRYLDRYAEQLWLTLFAKGREMTLFNFGQFERPIDEAQRGPWQGVGTSFDFDAMMSPWLKDDGSWPDETSLAMGPGYAFEQVDAVLAELGEPVGVPSYRPFHAEGEDFLHDYLGMLGIPIDLRPEFPADADTILLTKAAQMDADIVSKIEKKVASGGTVVMTSGLYKALEDRGIRNIVEMEVTDRKARVKDYQIGWFGIHRGEVEVGIPHVRYMTNDSWEEVSGQTNTTGNPIFMSNAYGKGKLYLLTIPDNFDDLYKLPVEVVAKITETVCADMPVRLIAPAQVMLFVYDNDTFIVESINDEAVEVKVVTGDKITSLTDLQAGDVFGDAEAIVDWRRQPTGKQVFTFTVKPHSYRVLRWVKGE